MLNPFSIYLYLLITGFTCRISCQVNNSSSSCSRIFAGNDSGSIVSPPNKKQTGYNKFCNYAIIVAPNAQVQMKFKNVALDVLGDSFLEFVTIFDGLDCMSERIGAVYGKETPTVVSSNNKITALFISNRPYDNRKFRANYLSVMGKKRTEPLPLGTTNRILENCGSELSGSFGTLSFKGDGMSNALCIWRIRVNEGKRVRVKFTTFKSNSSHAWLRILDGEDCGAQKIKFMDGTANFKPFTVKSTRNVMIVVYASALNSEETEVTATYREEAPMKATTPTTAVTPTTQWRDTEVSITTARVVRSPACSKQLTLQDWGSFESPNHLDAYEDHVMCNFAIKVSAVGKVKITFHDVQMTIGDVIPEYIVLFDGPDCMSSRIGAIYEGHTTMLIASKDRMTALFISDYTNGTGRFKADYTYFSQVSTLIGRRVPVDENNRLLDNCGWQLYGSTGSFSFKGDGKKNALCVWRISGNMGNQIHLRITNLKLDSKFSWLRVLDGDNCGAPELKLVDTTVEFSPFNCTSTSTTMTVVFASALGSEEAEVAASFIDTYTLKYRS